MPAPLPTLLSRRLFVRSLSGAASAGLLPWLACSSEDARDTEGVPDGRSDAGAAECPPFLTPTEDFFRQFGGSHTVAGWSLPELDESFALRIEGLVARPLSVDLAQLRADTEHQQTVLKTMMCVLGFRSTAVWRGVPLRVLLEAAGFDRAPVKRVRFFGADGFENNLRLSDVLEGPKGLFEPLIAFEINGEPLPRELGFPFRLLLNDRFGYKNIKWLARIELSAEDRDTGQYQESGYPDSGVIELRSRVENLRLSETVQAGLVEVCGFALAGQVGIERVELTLDQDEPEIARIVQLAEASQQHPEITQTLQVADIAGHGFPPPGVWAQFRAQLMLPAGEHRVTIRVVDRSGEAADGATLTLDARD